MVGRAANGSSGTLRTECEMTVAVDIPDDLERRLRDGWADMPRKVLEAVALEAMGADIVLLDEKAARTVAVGRGLRVSGLLGVLREAASRGLVDLPTAVQALLSAGFRASPTLLKSLLDTEQS